jgi:hypothetical protein
MLALVVAAALGLPYSSSSNCDASKVFKSVAAATGGSAWHNVGELVTRGSVNADGFKGSYRQAIDVVDGRYTRASEYGLESGSETYDGMKLWVQDSSRGSHPQDSPNALAGATTTAYLNRRAELAPSAAAGFRCVVPEPQKGDGFFIVTVVPRGGRPVTQWIDRRTFLVDRLIDYLPTSTVVTRFSDYRHVDGITIPFNLSIQQAGDSSREVFQTTNVEVHKAANAWNYRPPAPPVDTTGDSSLVPFSLEGGDIIFDAEINGKSLPFLLDTGGADLITP